MCKSESLSLAEWDAALLAAVALNEKSPSGKGWRSPSEMAEHWKMTVESAENRLRRLVALGLAENFKGTKVAVSDGKLRPFTWYRLKS